MSTQLPLFVSGRHAAHTVADAATGFAVGAGQGMPAAAHRHLWLCIYFPQFCLDALGAPERQPAAVLNDRDGMRSILGCNTLAREAGVAPGMPVNTALALCPALDLRRRREAAEADLLQARAQWALAYTPVVSIENSGALLLEIAGSVRLFGGLAALRRRLELELRGSGHRAVVLASAPTVKAALWLARSGKRIDCPRVDSLPGQLAELPLAGLGWPADMQQRLQQMGLRTLGACRRLPREGFARRFGPAYLHELDQAFGSRPDLRHSYRPPEVFFAELDVVPESAVIPEIIEGLKILIERLGQKLVRCQAAVRLLQVRLRHYKRPDTVIEIAMSAPSASVAYFSELLQLRLDRQLLPAPVTGVAIHTNLCTEFPSADTGVLLDTPAALGSKVRTGDSAGGSPGAAALPGPANDPPSTLRLLERLRARLGADNVSGLAIAAEHRPEYAWQVCEPGGSGADLNLPGKLLSRMRPLWLLAEPRRLATADGRPVHCGALEISGAAERIESGWWDGEDIRRDYYTALDAAGHRCWIYRDCRDSSWHLHGLFG